MATLQQLLDSFPTDSDGKGKAFEKAVKWYLENDPVYKTVLKNIWLWEDWPLCPGIDNGIDLVAETYDNKFWAIQAKNYNPDYYITQHDVDSFLAAAATKFNDSSNKECTYSFSLLVATTDKIGKNAEKKMAQQVVTTAKKLRSDLDNIKDWPADLNDLAHKPKNIKFSPRPHQERAICDAVSGFKNNLRGKVVMPCGTGKTLTALWIKERLKAKSSLVLFPSISLLGQTLTEWARHANDKFRPLVVCSDDSTTNDATEYDSIKLTSLDVGISTTTSVAEVKSFIQNNKNNNHIIFATYQSSPVVAQASTGHRFDIVIADEAHRCTGDVSNIFCTVLDEKNIGSRRKLFMTATPRYYTSNLQKKAGKDNITLVSMDDPVKYGPDFHTLTFNKAIDEGLLTDYQVVVMAVDHKEIANVLASPKSMVNDIKLDEGMLASHIGLQKAMEKFNLNKVITFHSKVKRASDFVKNHKEIVEWAGLDGSKIELSTYVSGEMSAAKRGKELNRLRNIKSGKGIVANARCLSEGVDVPSLDAVAFIDPKSSQVDIVQAIGRAIRKSPGKTKSTIVVPIFIDKEYDSTGSIDESKFKDIGKILLALRAHDEVLADSLDKMRKDTAKKIHVSINKATNGKVLVITPNGDPKFSSYIDAILLEKSTASWEFWYGLLEEYFKLYLDSLVPREFVTTDGYKLGLWVAGQRGNAITKNNTKRQNKLNELNFVWDVARHFWEMNIQDLIEYKNKHGDLFVPVGYKTERNNDLGSWVSNLRRENLNISQEQKEELKALGFDFSHKFDQIWNQAILELKKYKKTHGNTLVPKSFKTSSGFNLAAWVRRTRCNKKLSEAHKEELNSIGFVWNIEEQRWNLFFKELAEYKKEFGNLLVPALYKSKKINLGSQVASIRQRKKHIPDEYIEKLNNMGFVWDIDEYFWQLNISELAQFKLENGHTLVPQSFKSKSGVRLGAWCSNIRGRKLTSKRKSELNKLKFIWDTKGYIWMSKFNALKRYYSEFGHTNVPQAYKTECGINLGHWVGHIRRGTTKINNKQKRLLDKLSFWNK